MDYGGNISLVRPLWKCKMLSKDEKKLKDIGADNLVHLLKDISEGNYDGSVLKVTKVIVEHFLEKDGIDDEHFCYVFETVFKYVYGSFLKKW